MTIRYIWTMSSTSAELLRTARQTAGLTQKELAAQANITQSVVSAYEAGRREPAFSTLLKLIEAAGLSVSIDLVSAQGPSADVMQVVRSHQEELRGIFTTGGARNVRVCGSVARGTATDDSDIDFLVELDPAVSYFDLVEIAQELEAVLGRPVDVLPESNLHPEWKQQVLDEAIPLFS